MSLKKLSPIYTNKFKFVRDEIKNLTENSRILDVGCGYGEYIKLYKDNGLIANGIDIDKEAVKQNKEGIFASAEEIPFKDNFFDVVSCIDVLEHVDNPEIVIKEINRVLKKDGGLILSVPNYNFPFTYDPINYILKFFNTHLKIGLWGWGHKRLYRRKEILTLLKKNRFQIKKTKEISHFFIALFVNYIPYIIDKMESKKNDNYNINQKTRPSALFRKAALIYTVINKLDSKLFEKFKGINICIVAKKKN